MVSIECSNRKSEKQDIKSIIKIHFTARILKHLARMYKKKRLYDAMLNVWADNR